MPVGLPLSDILSPLVEAPRKNPEVTFAFFGLSIDIPPAHRLFAQSSIMLIVALDYGFNFFGEILLIHQDHLKVFDFSFEFICFLPDLTIIMILLNDT